MNKIRKVIHSYGQVESVQWVDYLEKNLSKETQNRIEQGNLHLHILEKLFEMVIHEDNIDKALNEKLDDWNLIVGLKREFEV